ncbi:MAG: peptidylprolyl isomerase [Erysipelotrichaceae bacterium]|nr:peptidylprolyl isomerase [Erysipelotrichaceae bacterium]
MKKWCLLAAAALLLFVGCDNKQKNEDDNAGIPKDVTLLQFEKPQSGDIIATMSTSLGDIKIHLFPKVAPKAVENFVTHAKEGYYNHITFHRVIPNFMIQSGDPLGNSRGGESIWGKPFEDEFSDQLYNFTGALSMANSGKDTNGSQFFIVQNKDQEMFSEDYFQSIYAQAEKKGWNNAGFIHPQNVKEKYREVGGVPYLDHQHTVFGQVIEGMDVVEKIANVQTGVNDRPAVDVLIEGFVFKEVK